MVILTKDILAENGTIPQEFKLPVPRPGITRELLELNRKDGSTLINVAVWRMSLENSALYDKLKPFCQSSPDPEISWEAMALYYEMFARTARINGGMPQLQSDLTASAFDQHPQEPDCNPEIQEFMAKVEAAKKGVLQQRFRPDQIEEIFKPLDLLRRVLRVN